MRSTPRHETITLSGVTGTVPPNGQHNQPLEHDTNTWHPQSQPQGAFYLNNLAPSQPRRGLSTGAVLGIIGIVVAVILVAAGAAAVFAPPPDTKPAAAASPDADGMGQPEGAAAPPPTTKGPLTVQLGETMIYTTSGFGSGDEVHYTLAAGKPVTRTKYGTRPEKGSFFALAATVNVVKGSAYIYGGDFALVAKDGTVYEATMSHAVDGGLEGVEARAGQKVAGLVVWDIPAGVHAGAKVELRAGGPGGNQGFWQLP